MAISPKSRGLGNIGNIVNRQGLVSPTKAAPKPVSKPAPKITKMPVPKPVSQVNPFAAGKPTTAAQRQAYQPFKSATKPVAKVNPMAGQPAMPMTPPQPFNPQPNPGQMPLDQLIRPEVGRDQYEVQREVEAMMGGGYNPGQQPGFQDLLNNYQPVPYDSSQGGGIFGGNLPGMVGNAVGQGLGGMFSNLGPMNDFGGQQALQQGIQGGLGQMFGGPSAMGYTTDDQGFQIPFQTSDFNGPMSSGDYNEVINPVMNQQFNQQPSNSLQTAFNPTSTKNPSNRNSGSLFGGGGFADNG